MSPYFRLFLCAAFIVLFLLTSPALARPNRVASDLTTNDHSLVGCFMAAHPWGTGLNGTPEYRPALFCKDHEGNVYPIIIFHTDKDRI